MRRAAGPPAAVDGPAGGGNATGGWPGCQSSEGVIFWRDAIGVDDDDGPRDSSPVCVARRWTAADSDDNERAACFGAGASGACAEPHEGVCLEKDHPERGMNVDDDCCALPQAAKCEFGYRYAKGKKCGAFWDCTAYETCCARCENAFVDCDNENPKFGDDVDCVGTWGIFVIVGICVVLMCACSGCIWFSCHWCRESRDFADPHVRAERHRAAWAAVGGRPGRAAWATAQPAASAAPYAAATPSEVQMAHVGLPVATATVVTQLPPNNPKGPTRII